MFDLIFAVYLVVHPNGCVEEWSVKPRADQVPAGSRISTDEVRLVPGQAPAYFNVAQDGGVSYEPPPPPEPSAAQLLQAEVDASLRLAADSDVTDGQYAKLVRISRMTDPVKKQAAWDAIKADMPK